MLASLLLCSFIFSFFCFQKASGTMSLRKLNMISYVFYLYVFLQVFIGVFLISTNQIEFHYLLNKVNDTQAITNGIYSISYFMVAFPIGMLLANSFFKKSSKVSFANYIKSDINNQISSKDSYIRFPLYFCTLLSIIGVSYTYYYIGGIPLLSLLNGKSALEMAVFRTEIGRNFGGIVYIKNLFGLTLTPILSYIAYFYYLKTKSFSDLMWWWLLLVLTILILTYNLEKSPLVFYLIGYFFATIYAKGELSRKFLIFTGITLVSLIVAMYVSIAKVTDPSVLFSLTSGIGGRLMLSQIVPTFLTFEYFPEKINFIGLSSLSSLWSSLFNLPHSERSARLIMEIANPYHVEQGTAGVLNTLFIAEAWANFGWLGVFISPVYVGFLHQLFFRFLLKLSKTPLSLSLFTYYSYKSSVMGGFNDYFYNPGFWIVITIIITIFFIAKYLRTITNSKVSLT